jgi:TatD DNase family protein
VQPDEKFSITDTHCHLDFRAYDEDREEVLRKANEAGVTRILNPGIDLPSSREALSLAHEFPQVFAAAGIHPNDASTFRPQLINDLRELIAPGGTLDPRVVAVGEIGLDYYRDRTPYELQKQALQYQLLLAAELNLPVIIHNRQASADLLPILFEWRAQLIGSRSPLADRPGVLHSFSDSLEVGQAAIENGFYIGLTGPVTFTNALVLQKIVAELPLSSLLVETDGPFLTPHPHRGHRNTPANVRLVVKKIAELKALSYSDVSKKTTENAGKLFNW